MTSIRTFEPDTLIKNPDACRVTSAVEIESDAHSVWGVVGNFAGFPVFIPALAQCEVTGTGVRCVRKKLFKDGNVVIEQLNSHDDREMFMTWSLIYTTLNVGNLWAAMTVQKLGDKQCLATWTIVAEPLTGGPETWPAFEAFLQGFADEAMSNVRNLFN